MKEKKLIKFNCRRCGRCCDTNGRIYLYFDDINRLSSNMSLDVDIFIKKYCEFRREIFVFRDQTINFEILSLAKKHNNNQCVFLNEGLCLVHDFKPLQCKLAPFIEPIITNKEVWEDFKNKCPGFMDGKTYSNKEIFKSYETLKLERINYFNRISENNYSLKNIIQNPLSNSIEKVININQNYNSYYESNDISVDEIFSW